MTLKMSAITYLVKDYDEAIAWFIGALGFVLAEDTDMGEGKRWVLVAPNNGGVRLLLAKAVGQKQIDAIGRAAGGRVAFFLNTENFIHDHARMMAAGVKFNETPRYEPYGTVAVFCDLYGNLWDLIEPTPKN
jgi:catechol 2,3-dioxygenase-like lactoylglutathione lyase family enzyme